LSAIHRRKPEAITLVNIPLKLRRGRELNPRIQLLQSCALPLGYLA
jgi:hypothetical protein